MRRFGKLSFVMLSVTVMLALSVSVAFASSVHIKDTTLRFFDNGLTLTASGSLAGLGNGDVVVTDTAAANPTATCANKGTNEAPGQNPAPITVTGSEGIPNSQIKNGNTPFSVTTNAPQSPVPGAPDCPNPNWTETITDMAFTSATIRVYQPGEIQSDGSVQGILVLTVSCSFLSPTTNGAVPSSNVSCSSS